MRPLRPEVKAINEIKEHGYATMSGVYNESEAPEEWSVLEVWLTLGRPVLYFDYEWRRGKYHFYLEGKKEEARENRKKTVGSLDVYNAEEFLYDSIPSLLKIAASIKYKPCLLPSSFFSYPFE